MLICNLKSWQLFGILEIRLEHPMVSSSAFRHVNQLIDFNHRIEELNLHPVSDFAATK